MKQQAGEAEVCPGRARKILRWLTKLATEEVTRTVVRASTTGVLAAVVYWWVHR